ncbi:MAG: LacI family DNA-binding transcriptional regulator [Bacteroidales bacterium]|nr:LacI family DNA-binding transcriptional regulator [Bacteroidales bacterium]
MVSMQDIADRLNVSRSTVSLVLSGKAGSRVSDATKKEVLKVAKEMNYQINALAKSLRTGESKLIGVIVTDISNEFFGHLTSHIQEYAKRAGYLVLTINSNESAQEFDEMVGILIGRKVEGIIAVPPPGGEASIARIISQGIPLVTVDRMCKGLNADYVGVDNYGSARKAVGQLLDDGYRKIGMIGLDLDIPPLNERQAAYSDAMNAAGYGGYIKICHIRFGEEGNDVEKAMREMQDSEAVFFTSRRVFTEAMSHAARTGVGPRPDQCLLCFDDISLYMTMMADVRFIEQPIGEMARKAFELLIAQIRGNTVTGSYLFPTNCVTRRSIR